MRKERKGGMERKEREQKCCEKGNERERKEKEV